MPSEQTPLLQNDDSYDERAPLELFQEVDHYNRFKPGKKRAIVLTVAFAGLIPLFVSGSFIPSIPQIAREFETSGAVVNLAVSASIFSACIGTLFWAVYSGYYGRRPVFLVSSIVFCVGSMGVTLSRSIRELIAFRIFQALGCASAFSNGVGVLGDLYRLEERGTAMGVFYGAVLLGPAIAPVVGGTVAELYSWRAMQAVLFASGCIFFTLILFFFPETIHPGSSGAEKASTTGFVILNPFKSLTLVRSPVILCIVVAGITNLMADFFLVVPVAYTVAKKYNITSEAAIGALLIPDGVGSMLGAPIIGHISDKIIAQRRRRRGGVWVPEDRLRGLKFSGLILIPSSLLIAGYTTTYVDGTLGLVINLFCLFINGFGVDSMFTTLSAYGVDILHDRSAEITAASMAYRGTVISLAIAGLLPSIDTIGLMATYTITAVISLFGYFLVWIVIQYGDRMRAYVDIGFSTAHAT
ncbi:MFS general substrate transporter [Cristinia sonorae]|uniref:MFS general substrate transporter n=1 Tax=Cristinia sonorae TaxID=1940300 RepID=A0A8K0XPK0_9AGAR|nr:MFS general substrate transporter [Cristinia sonorae]